MPAWIRAAVASANSASGARSRAFALASIVLLAVAYTFIAFVVLEPDATYSVDTTVKYVQAHTLLGHKFVYSGFLNGGAFIDPGGKFLPFTSPYVFSTPSGWQSIFPTASALLLAPFSPWGLTGLTVPALLSALLLLWVTWRFGSGAAGQWALPGILGVATILWFYATSPNEHALSAALTTAALLLALDGRGRTLAVAGLLLGLAGTVRDESLLVAPGLVLARVIVGTRAPAALARETAMMAGMALVPLLAIAGLDGFVYHRPISAHLLHAVAPLQDWLPPESVRGLPALPVIPWSDRPDVLVHQWLVGVGTPLEKGLVMSALVAAVGIRRWTGSALGLVAVLGMLAAWRVADLAVLVTLPKFVGGLYRLCPFLLFALVPLPGGVRSSRARRLALVTAACYLALAVVGLNTVGGKSFGPRLLFPVLPLLTVAAVESIVGWVSRFRVSRVDALVGGIGVVLVAVSAVMQFGVALPAWAARNHADYLTISRVSESKDPIVVIDNPSAVQLVTPFYFERVVLLAVSQPAGDDLAGRLLAAHVRSFTVLSRYDKPPVSFASFGLVAEAHEGRLTMQRWRR